MAHPPPITDAAGMLARLARLRGQVLAWFWVEGLGRVMWLALCLAASDMVIDWLVRLDRPQRAVMLALLAAGLGYGIHRWLLRPLSIALSDDALALAVEAAHPRLNQSFITALQLARAGAAAKAGMSPALWRQAVSAGFRNAQEIRFGSVLNSAKLIRNSMMLLGAASVWISLAVLALIAPPLQTWLSRNLLLSKATWPQATYLVVERSNAAGAVIVPRGEEATLVVSVTPDSRVVPSAVYLDFHGAGGRTPLPMKKSGDRRFVATISRLTEPLEFRARGGDALTEWVRAEPVERPAVIAFKLEITPPNYTGGRPAELTPGLGPYAVLPGSRLALAITASKPLVEATLAGDGERLLPSTAANRPAKPEAVSVALTARDATHFSGQIAPSALLAGQYRLELVDELGLASRPVAFTLVRRVDQPPQVRVRLIDVRGQATPPARVAFAGQITDDFGLQSVKMIYHYAPADSADGERQGEHLLFNDQGAANAARANGAAAALTAFDLESALDLGPLHLAPGGSLSIRIEATDNDNVSGPHIGRSPEFVLRIVSPDALRADLLRRETEQRAQLQRLIKEQESLVTESQALQASFWQAPNTADERLPPELTSQCVALERQQKQVGERVQAVSEQLSALAAEVRSNRLEEAGGRWETRLTHEIAAPLLEIFERPITQAAQELGSVRQQNTPAAVVAALTRASAQQTSAAARMTAVLQQMVSAESFQEAVNLLHEIESAQAAVQRQTERAREERIRQILDQGAPR